VPDVTVIIPARDRPDELVEVLRDLAAQDFPRQRFEVLVCDDGSATDLRQRVEQMKSTGLDLSYLRQPPRGPATARNLGIRNARGVIVAMTDSDTRPDASWLRYLVEALEGDSEAAGVEGLVRADNVGQYDPLGEGPSNLEGGVFLTCNMAYRRSVLESVGGFDETFPYPAYEDTDLAARVMQSGRRIIWEARAVVIHPQRPLTLRSVFKKLRHWEYVFLMGLRYGYLGWKKYPTRHPRIRVAALSTIALPLSKFKTALSWSLKRPFAAMKLAFFGVFEAVGALFLVVPRVLFGKYTQRSMRGSFLELESLNVEKIRLK
jgi:cellulose synthase/poly-beta-1,6-N-acetylglucosamine synthase-like glycosyltransferase